VNAAQVDISKIKPGQTAQIAIDALPGRVFTGTISEITPAITSTSGVVNYPVTIKLDPTNLADVRAGMTAVATLEGESARNEWLVPTNSLTRSQGKTTVTVVQGNQQTQVEVTPGPAQGEWTVVQADGLKAGDQVVA
jgi:multidrug efflux pump subunit AcrA (membrane-fusion protein)